jgi:AraC-like DNA-binding protein
MPKRIAFALASLEREANSYEAWFSSYALRDGVSLFVFPGGRLHHVPRNEYLDNPLYSMIGLAHPDCLISWASSIGGTATLEDITQFHQETFHMPFVTIAHKIEGHCDVSFNAYTAMKEEILHLVEVHHKRKIAFLRGPATHRSAEERYVAYCTVMRLKGFDVDERLVSSPSQWHDWEAPIKELVIKRNLVPGKDFDAIVCVNDDVMYATSAYLEELGFHIPYDVAIVGFNDARKSLMMPCPGTTIAMPVEQLADKAWNRAVAGGVGGDCLIPCSLHIRRSCGCHGMLSVWQNALSCDDSGTFASIVSQGLDVSPSDVRAMMVAEGKEDYLEQLEQALASYLPSHPDMSALLDAIALYQKSCAPQHFREQLMIPVVSLISACMIRIQNAEAYHASVIDQALSRIKNGMVLASDYHAVVDAVMSQASLLGVDEFHLVFQREDNVREYAGGFCEEKQFAWRRLFPAGTLLPNFLQIGKIGTTVVLPIHSSDAMIGYAVLYGKYPEWKAVDEIRSFLNLTIPAVRMHGDTLRLAEKTEEEYARKTAFLRSVSDEMARIADDCAGNCPSVAARLSVLRERIRMGIDQERMIKETCSLNALFLQIGYELPDSLPVVMGNVRSCQMMLQQILETWGIKRVSAEETPEGVKICIGLKTTQGIPMPPVVTETMAIHGGSAMYGDGFLFLLFPYPLLFRGVSLCGTHDYVVSDSKKPGCLSISQMLDGEMPSDIRTLFWKTSFHSHSAAVVLDILKAKHQSMHIASPAILVGYENVETAIRKDLTNFRVPLLYHNDLENAERNLLSQEFETMQATERNGFLSLEVKVPADALLVVEDQTLLNNLLHDFPCQIFFVADTIPASLDSVILEHANLFPLNRFVLSRRECIHQMSLISHLGRNAEMVKTAILTINREDPQEVNRSHVAKAVGVCDDYLTKLFHVVIGISPRDYILSMKIANACHLLKTTDLALKGIASCTGFSDPSYFCRIFKANTGYSPDAYRRKKR